MSYNLAFLDSALKEWRALDGAVREQFKKKLTERLDHPRVPKDRLHGSDGNRYKMKLRAIGYRLVYEVRDAEVVVLVIAVGRREGRAVQVRDVRRPACQRPPRLREQRFEFGGLPRTDRQIGDHRGTHRHVDRA